MSLRDAKSSMKAVNQSEPWMGFGRIGSAFLLLGPSDLCSGLQRRVPYFAIRIWNVATGGIILLIIALLR